MSFVNAHQSIQKSIWNYAKSSYVGGTLKAILAASRLNQSITAKDLGSEDGKKRELKLNYLPPICSDNASCEDTVCNTLTPKSSAPSQTYFKLSQCTASEVLSIKMDDMRELDSIGANEWAMAMLNQRLEAVRRKLEYALTALVVSNMGLQPDGNAETVINIIDQTNGQLIPSGIWDLERAFIDAELNPPFVIGSAPVYNIERLKSIAAINAIGQDIEKVETNNWFYDKYINGAVGNNTENLIAFDPQLVKFIAFNYNAGRFATDLKDFEPESMFKSGSDFMYSTIVDQATGILWDLDVNWDKCAKQWNFQWRLNWDLFVLPVDVCGIQGMNGIMHFTTCPPMVTRCASDTVVSGTTLPGTTYTYTPKFQFPLTVNQFTVNGNTYKPRTVLYSAYDMVEMFKEAGVNLTEENGTLSYVGYINYYGFIDDVDYSFSLNG